MNAILLLIISIPLIEIYLMIKIGGTIGALNTILLIFFTAFTGLYFAKLAGINAIRSGFDQILKNKTPIYEIISGAALALAALLLIIPGFLTDVIGFLLIVPFTRKFLIKIFSSKINKRDNNEFNKRNDKEDFIEGEFEENKEDKS